MSEAREPETLLTLDANLSPKDVDAIRVFVDRHRAEAAEKALHSAAERVRAMAYNKPSHEMDEEMWQYNRALADVLAILQGASE